MTAPAATGFTIPRSQLALFLPNDKLIQDFEQQQTLLTGTLPDAVELAQATADAAQATADVALTRLTNSSFLTLLGVPSLANSRQLAPSADFVLTDGGPGTTAALALAQQTVILAGDVADVTGAFVDATGALAALAANSSYLVEANITFQSAGVGVGIGLALTLPVGATLCGGYRHNVTATTEQAAYNNAAGAVSGNTTAVPIANDNLPLIGRWVIRTAAAAGNAQLRFRTGTAATAVTLKAGLTVLSFRKVA